MTRYSGTPTNIRAFLQGVHLPSIRPPDLDPNPMSPSQNDPVPWWPQCIGGDVTQYSRAPRHQSPYDPNYLLVASRSIYREPPGSELGSSTTGRHLVDSECGSRSLPTKSVRSAEPIEQSQSYQSPIEDVNEMRNYSDEQFSSHIPGRSLALTNEASYYYNLPTTEPMESPATPFLCIFPGCGNHVSKNLSEFKYVPFDMQNASSNWSGLPGNINFDIPNLFTVRNLVARRKRDSGPKTILKGIKKVFIKLRRKILPIEVSVVLRKSVLRRIRSGLVLTTSANIVIACIATIMSMNPWGIQLFLRVHADTWSVGDDLVPWDVSGTWLKYKALPLNQLHLLKVWQEASGAPYPPL